MKSERYVYLAAVVGALVFLNVVGASFFGRLDLTRDNQYTLSDTTKDTLRTLTDPVTVKAYFSADLPPQFAMVSRYVKDLLDEYYSRADGYFAYEFIDPLQEETAEDKEKKKDIKRDILGRAVREKTSVELELERLGIPPLQVQVRREGKVEVGQAFMGLAVRYGEQTEVIPVVRDTSTLEYDLTSLIKKLTRATTPKVAFVTAGGDFDVSKEMGRTYGLLSQLYEVTTLDLNTATEIGSDISAIVVVARGAFSDAAKRAIDAFIMSGKSAAFLVDNIAVDLSTLQTTPVEHGLKDMLARYGVSVADGLVLDAECAIMTVQQQRGFMRIPQPVRFPFIPIAKELNQENVLTRGLNEVALPFAAPLSVSPSDNGAVKADVLVSSSAKSWITTSPYNLDPFQQWTVDKAGELKRRDLMVALTGAIPSAFAQAEAEGEDAPGAAESRVVVVGTSSLMADQFASPTNLALAQNLVDWLVMDQGLLAMRTRGLSAAPIEAELGEGGQLAVQWLNIAGLPMMFVAFGLVRWRRREARRSKVTL